MFLFLVRDEETIGSRAASSSAVRDRRMLAEVGKLMDKGEHRPG
jgi:hypothetical protein